MNHKLQAQYMQEFVNTYFQTMNDKYFREAECLKVQTKYLLSPLQNNDIVAGRTETLIVGFSAQENGMGYYFNEDCFQELLLSDSLPQEIKEDIIKTANVWREQTSESLLKQKYPNELVNILESDRFSSESGVAFYLTRMSGSQLDYGKLLKYGISGLQELIKKKESGINDETSKRLYHAMSLALDTVSSACLEYAGQAEKLGNIALSDSFLHISQSQPNSFLEAVQLMYLYAVISGTYNYGRMDDYLGDFLAADLESGRFTYEEALQITISLWSLISGRKTTWDGRVVIGGRGRKNEKNADLFARMAMQASRKLKDTLPQLSLRFYQGQDTELLDYAYECIGEGCIYPILYNDDVNIPSVKKAFSVSDDEATDYIPFGCGEYILYHRSFGTPSGVVNLLKALEITLFQGYDINTGKKIGLNMGHFEEMKQFDELFNAYKAQVEYFVKALARQEKYEYEIASEHSPYLLFSILYDNCIEIGKAIFDGGIPYLGGTLECYGNVNTADSLTAIKSLVYDSKTLSQSNVLEMVRKNFEGFEQERKMLLNAPKYGNDDDVADDMVQKVHNHICKVTKNQAEVIGLHNYLAVMINNSANTQMGVYTSASCDGRKAGMPMANANNPMGGRDKLGITAFLNSIIKPRTDIHAGSVQNMKFSKEMFGHYLEKTKFLLQTYFNNGGSQAMITVLNREDLEKAIAHPEDYQNLIVRVGGFCARFVELEKNVQLEVMSRTLY